MRQNELTTGRTNWRTDTAAGGPVSVTAGISAKTASVGGVRAATRPVVVVGGGVGGLSAAIALAGQGVPVTLLEAHSRCGGKMRSVDVAGGAIDAGPTVFTMRWVFERLFDSVGASFASRVRLAPLHTLARHAWDSTRMFDLPANRDRAAEAVGDFFGAAEARGYERFAADARKLHHAMADSFMAASKPSPLDLARRLGLAGTLDLIAARPDRSMWQALGRYFNDPRLRQLFGRFATYCGGSPFETASTLMLIADVEQDGVWSVEGGMAGLSAAMQQLAVDAGVEVRCDAPVARITMQSGRASGVVLANGETLPASAIVFNGDPGALADGLLGPEVSRAGQRLKPGSRSLSALTWLVHAPVGGAPLLRHTVLFSGDYAREFADLRGARTLPRDPTIYLCAQDRESGTQLPAGAPERLLMLVNAPADTPLSPQEIARCQAALEARLSRCGLDLTLAPDNHVICGPQTFAGLFPGSRGAIYGRAPHGPLAPFLRPGARTPIPGLYLAGGGVHPSAGVPMAGLSGWTAAQAVLTDRHSTQSHRRAAMSGGISMPSATTGVMG
jgi:1-hydroxycarotenoid 3,4-desaturase